MKHILTLAGMMAAVIIASSCSTSHTLVDDQGNPLSKEQLKQYQASLPDRKSGSAGMPRPISYAVFCLKKKRI